MVGAIVQTHFLIARDSHHEVPFCCPCPGFCASDMSVSILVGFLYFARYFLGVLYRRCTHESVFRRGSASEPQKVPHCTV